MGQQQLLLLVLGVVIVGLGTAVGIQSFAEGQLKNKRDQTQQLMIDIAAKAQAWKLMPQIMGGGANNDDDDYSAFTFANAGLGPTFDQGGNEVLQRTSYSCIKAFPTTTGLRLNALDENCTSGSWTMSLEVTGPGEDGLTWSYR
ncbi:MAG: hypothetical protein AAF845_20855 [Bacteroidota bacterium]